MNTYYNKEICSSTLKIPCIQELYAANIVIIISFLYNNKKHENMANFIHLVKITVNTTFRCQNDRTYLAKARFLFFPRSISGKNNNNNNNKWVNMDSLQL